MYLNGKFINTDDPTQLEWCSRCIKQPVNISNQTCWNHLGSSFEGLAIAEKSDEVPKLEYFTKFDVNPEILHAEAATDQHGGEVKSVSVEMGDMVCTPDGHIIICVSSIRTAQSKRSRSLEHKHAYALLKYTDKGKYVDMCKLGDVSKSICTLPSGTEAVVSNRHGIQFINIPEMTPGRTIRLGSECGGVFVNKGMLYVGDTSNLYIVDLIGRLYNTIQVPCLPESICTNKDGRLYCTSKNMFFCLKNDGSIIYSYNSSDLGQVTAVKVDKRGNIYVAGSEIQVFYPYKQKMDRVLRKEDGNGDISAFCLSNDFSRMFIGHNERKCVGIYTLQNAQ